ncbi:MAG: TrmJ/YjtD family RNA methyltransferase [Gammaproteobacteria bacterium]
MLENIKIVLVETSHPGNIGAAARAMKNFGLSNLCLVKPKNFPHVDATARAAGADDILARGRIVENVQEAIADCHLVIGTSARQRALPSTLLSPREAATEVTSEVEEGRKIAILFGRENSGLTNEELHLCQKHLYVSTDPNFSSLNLAAAVLLVAYEINKKHVYTNSLKINKLYFEVGADLRVRPSTDMATSGDIELFYEHLEKVLIELEFLNPKAPKHLMDRMRRLFGRTRLEVSEVNILRGVLTEMEKNMVKNNPTEETDYLLKSRENAKRLLLAATEVKQGKYKERKILK